MKLCAFLSLNLQRHNFPFFFSSPFYLSDSEQSLSQALSSSNDFFILLLILPSHCLPSMGLPSFSDVTQMTWLFLSLLFISLHSTTAFLSWVFLLNSCSVPCHCQVFVFKTQLDMKLLSSDIIFLLFVNFTSCIPITLISQSFQVCTFHFCDLPFTKEKKEE